MDCAPASLAATDATPARHVAKARRRSGASPRCPSEIELAELDSNKSGLFDNNNWSNRIFYRLYLIGASNKTNIVIFKLL
jgi:hypothetical protein